MYNKDELEKIVSTEKIRYKKSLETSINICGDNLILDLRDDVEKFNFGIITKLLPDNELLTRKTYFKILFGEIEKITGAQTKEELYEYFKKRNDEKLKEEFVKIKRENYKQIRLQDCDFTDFKKYYLKFLFVLRLGFGKTGKAKQGKKNTLMIEHIDDISAFDRYRTILKSEISLLFKREITTEEFDKYHREIMRIAREKLEMCDMCIIVGFINFIFVKECVTIKKIDVGKLYVSVCETEKIDIIKELR